MTTEKKKSQKDADGQSTVPPNWPGIPGRSTDHERNANGQSTSTPTTEQQRELERQVPQTQRR